MLKKSLMHDQVCFKRWFTNNWNASAMMMIWNEGMYKPKFRASSMVHLFRQSKNHVRPLHGHQKEWPAYSDNDNGCGYTTKVIKPKRYWWFVK